MKKNICILVAFLLLASTVPLFAMGQIINTQEITEKNIDLLEYNYVFSNPKIKKVEHYGEQYSRIEIDNCKTYWITGEPCYPVKPIRILLPQGKTVENINVITSEPDVISNVNNVELGFKTYALSEAPPTEPPEPNYDIKSNYPGTLYNNIGVQYFRGYPILHVNLHPVQYHGESETLTYYPQMKLEIETKQIDINPLYRGLEKDRQRVLNQIDNVDSSILNTFEPKKTTSTSTAEYIIITTNSWVNDFQPLLNSRQSEGLSTMIKTVSSIESEYSGDDTEEDIRLFIKDAYQNLETDWVLLGGDQEYVPARYLYDIDGGDGTLTSDLYYQCLDGNYNYDGDGYYGEKYDGVGGNQIDLYAEVYAGRASVDSSGQIDNFIDKTLAYEDYDWGADSNLEVCDSVGEYLGFGGVSEYAKPSLECNIDHCTDHGQDTHGIPSANQDYTNNIMTIQGRYEADGGWSDDDIEDDLDDGINFINHLGHASPTSCMKFNPSEIFALTNTKFAFWYSQGCHPGQFEVADECMAEAWTVADYGGFAAIMNTGYGYGAWSSTDGPDNRFSREFWDALFYPPEGISQISVANQDSTQDNMWHINDGNCMYHDAYQNTLFGDPFTVMGGAEDFGADFHWDLEYPNPGEAIHFYSDSVGANSYHWQFGDGGTSTQKNPVHTYTSEGEWEVTLVIYGGGESDSCKKICPVFNNWPPEAIATPDLYAGNNPTVSFDGSSSWDPDGTITDYLWNFDDGTTSTQVSPTHTFTEDGYYEVTLTVTDDDGKDSDPFACEIYIDAETPPETDVIIQGQHGENGWVKSTVSVILQAYDWSGVDYTKYRIDEGSWMTYYGPHSINTNGPHDLEYYSVDIWGNVEEVHSTTFKIDQEKPSLDVDLDGQTVGEWYVSPVTIYCDSEDYVSGMKWIRYLIVDQMDEWATYTAPFEVTGDGTHVVRIYAEDFAGNTVGKTGPYVVEIDMGPPTTSCELFGNQQPDGWYDGEVTVTLNAEDLVSGVNSTYYKLDDSTNYVKYTGSFKVNERGSHDIFFYSIDELGNEETEKTDNFKIGAPPSIPTIDGPTKGNANEEQTWTVSSTHPEGSDLEFFVDWGDGETTDWFGPYISGEEVEITHTYTEEKINTFRVKARDQWGGESDWGTFEFSTPKSKNRQGSILLDILSFILEKFPILEKILELPIIAKIIAGLNA